MTIDLNCDVGELADAALEAELMEYITSANVACGEHAGTGATMARAVRLALARGARIGAHPGYPDPANFGRVEMAMSSGGVERMVREQILRLAAAARMAGATLVHVKPHGALYHAAMRDVSVARAIGTAVRAYNPAMVLFGQPGTAGLDVWRRLGLTVWAEGFADRRYEPDGSLRSRTLPDALITDPDAAAEQAVSLARSGRVQTICVHGDTPGAPAILRACRQALDAIAP